MGIQYKQNFQDFVLNKVKSGQLSHQKGAELYSILNGRMDNEGGIGSQTFVSNSGEKIGVHTYKGRTRAAMKLLEENLKDDFNFENELDSLYNVISSGSYKVDKRGNSVDDTFNEIAKNNGLEGIVFDAMSDSINVNDSSYNVFREVDLLERAFENNNNSFDYKVSDSKLGIDRNHRNIENAFEDMVLKASQDYETAKEVEVMPSHTVVDEGIKKLRGFGAVAIIGLMYLGLGILAPTLGYAKAPKVNSNPTPVVETLDNNDEKFITPSQNSTLEDMIKENVANYSHELNSGEVLNKRWREVFNGLGEITPYEATNLSLIYANELAKKGINININKLPVGYEVQGEVILGNEAVQDFIMYKADLMRSGKLEFKPFNFAHYNLYNEAKKQEITKHETKLTYDNDLKLRNISEFKSFEEFESYFNTLSLNFPSGTNFWLVGKQTLKALGLPYNARMLKYFQKAIEEKKKINLNNVLAGSSTSLNGVLDDKGIAVEFLTIIDDYFKYLHF